MTNAAALVSVLVRLGQVTVAVFDGEMLIVGNAVITSVGSVDGELPIWSVTVKFTVAAATPLGTTTLNVTGDVPGMGGTMSGACPSGKYRGLSETTM